MKIVVTVDSAYIEEAGRNIADITLIGGLYGVGNTVEKQAELEARHHDELRGSAVEALAMDYCPPHFEAMKLEMQRAVQNRADNAPQLCVAYDALKWAWARSVAPTLEVERRY